ncbi:MAG TPA: class I SAM-dependent methyltransferase [Solirubrobacteraceae bacterium]
MDPDQAYFEDQLHRSVPEFWRRMGYRPDCAGRRVLDLGCGHGAMSLELAAAGADVLGIDLNDELIGWARVHVQLRPVAGRLRFLRQDVRTLAEGEFDLVVSKDSFEHIQELGSVLAALRGRLAPGGRIWAGFSPLFYSPRGDHGEMGLKVPWAHVPSRRFVLAAAARRRGASVGSLGELGLNGIAPGDFRRLVSEAGLRFEFLRYNPGDKRLLALLRGARRIPALERYATVGIYSVLAPV